MPVGRIILKSISDSKKVSLLKTDGSRLLYTWLLTHLDVNGCYSGDAQVINGKVFTRLNKSTKMIEDYLKDMEVNQLIIRYQINGDIFLNVPDFVEKQPSLNPAKEGKTTIPTPTPELLQSYSRVTPPKVKISKVKISKVNDSSDPLQESEPPSKIIFNFDTSKWEGITDNDLKLFGKAYPAAVLDVEFAKMKAWILANGAKGYKKNWRAFITRWLTKCQDYGGTKNV